MAARSHLPRTLDASILNLLACPACLASLRADADRLTCTACGRIYPVLEGIPVLIAEVPERTGAQNDSIRIPGNEAS